jgi:glutamate synthase domain-containing protein 2
MSNKDNYIERFALYTTISFIGIEAAAFLGRKAIAKFTKDFMTKLTTDKYEENIWGMISSLIRTGPQNVIEIGLRAERGEVIQRPMGTPRRYPNLNGLVFNFTYLDPMPTPLDTPVDLRVTIGKEAKAPLKIAFPVMVSAMAYGLALSERVKIAMAQGASMAGTATNTGEGPPLPEERENANKLIVQVSRGGWTSIDAIRSSDMVELQLGQGTSGGIGRITKYSEVVGRPGKLMGLEPKEDVLTHVHLPKVREPEDLKRLVDDLRYESGGVPIGVKIGASTISLERDMDIIVSSGVDFITIDGSTAATKGSPPILQDDFGIPSLLAIPRAVQFLESRGMKGKVDIIASGKLLTPGDYLKAIALGASAVYSGTSALLAVSHRQTEKLLPWEPPGTIIWYTGAKANTYDVKLGAKSLANYLNSVKMEMADGLRAMGKNSVGEVGPEDLRALDLETYLFTGIKPAFPLENLSFLVNKTSGN